MPDADLSRYHRQMLLPGIGEDGQRRISTSHALLIGCGALGCAIADQLARAGVGTITIVDRDIVELTNLQRQTLFDESDAAAGSPKAEAAAARLRRINSSIQIRPVVADFGSRNAETIALKGGPRPAVVLDGTDNFMTRYLINDLCVKHSIPFIYGGAIATSGMSMTVIPGMTPCLRCLFDQPPAPGNTPTCDTAGVLGAVTTTIGAHQAAEAIKILAGRPEAASRALLEIDMWSGRQRRLDVSAARRVSGEQPCECCVQHRYPYLSGDLAADSTVLCGRNAVQVNPPLDLVTQRLDLDALAARLRPHGVFEATRVMLRGRLTGKNGEEGLELTVFPDGRAIIRGTLEPALARSIYARYVGS
jgi:adenylyltransferase/sulfurtransferase